MNKIYLYLSLIFLIFFLPNAYAEEEFIKDEQNPIEIVQEFDNWKEVGQRQPFILHEGSKYKMWYTSQGSSLLRIGYAESESLDTFTSKNIIDLNYDSSYHFHDPFIIKDNNTY